MKRALSELELELLRFDNGEFTNSLGDLLVIEDVGRPRKVLIGAAEAGLAVPRILLFHIPRGADAVYEKLRSDEPDGSYHGVFQYCHILKRKY